MVMKVPRLAVLTVGVLIVTAAGGAASNPGGQLDSIANLAQRPDATAAEFTGAGTAVATQDAALAARPEATVTLVTGDRVRVDALGAEPVGATSGPGSSTFLEFGSNGDRYVVPSAALPYLGSTLDMELFNVSALARLENPDSPTLAVTIEQSQPGSAQNLPAVAVTGTADTIGTTVTATITKAQAHQFGKLLADQFAADGTGLLPGITRIGLAEAVTSGGSASTHLGPPANRPSRYHTLTLKFVGHDGGAPALGTLGTAGFVQNLDDHRLSPGFQLIPAGQDELRLSVPEGNYSAVFGITRPNPLTPGQLGGTLVAEPQFRMDRNRTVTLDARTAVPYQVSIDESITTPSIRWDRLHFARTSARGDGDGDGSVLVAPIYMGLISRSVVGGARNTMAATPTSSPVTTGDFGFRGTTFFAADGGSAQQPVTESMYLLDFPHPEGIPESLSYTVEESELTTVHNEIYRAPVEYERPNPILATDIVFHAGDFAMNAGLNRYVPAGERTDYWYSAAPELTVWQQRVSDHRAGYASFEGTVGAPRHIRPGEEIHVAWNKGPLVPSPAALTGMYTPPAVPLDVWSTWCVACRQDDNGALMMLPEGDSDRSHAGTPLNHYSLGGRVSHLDFYRDGELVLSGGANGTAPNAHLNPTDLYLPLLPTEADYRLDWTVAEKDDLASHTRTRWTFRSGRDDPAADLPEGMQCAPDASRSCSFLPLLFVTYDLALDHLSRAAAGGPFEIAFTVGHQQGQAAPRGVSANVAVSYDGGENWSQPRAATAGPDGTFTTTVQHPPLGESNGFVALRVQATDAEGNTVEQRITRAYGLTE